MKDFLTKKQVVELKSAHQTELEMRFADRIKAVLMLNSGLSVSRVSEYLLLDEKTIRKYRDSYQASGLDGLCSDGYLGGASFLTEAQQDSLILELRSQIYPSSKAVQKYVKKSFRIDYV